MPLLAAFHAVYAWYPRTAASRSETLDMKRASVNDSATDKLITPIVANNGKRTILAWSSGDKRFRWDQSELSWLFAERIADRVDRSE